MKTNIKLLVAFVAMAMVACQEPYEVPPTTTSIGIHSVTATFLKGPLSTNALAKFTADVTSLEEDIVIPIPYYFPEDSNDQITDITQMRVEASMDYNCFLEPGLAVLDLTKRNEFLYTDGRGEQHNIVIRGEIRKLSLKEIVSLSVSVGDTQLITIIDKENKVVNISYTDATEPLIGACKVEYEVSPHATCSLDGVESVDLTTLKEIAVTAHDGTTQTYTVVSQNNTPKKVNYGYAAGSEEELWCLEMTGMGIPNEAGNNQSLAVVGRYLVVCRGNGDTPIYLNKTTGKKLGTIALGDASPGFVKNDDAGNLLICSHEAGKVNIWRTNDVTKEPTLFISYTHTNNLPIGGRMCVQGDIDGDALVMVVIDGIVGGAGSNQIIYWEIRGGVVGEPQVATLTGFVGSTWLEGYWTIPYQGTDGLYPAICPLGTSASDGFFFSLYSENALYYFDGALSATMLLGDRTDNANGPANYAIDVKTFNNARYVVLFSATNFPEWSRPSYMQLFDMSNLKTVNGAIDDSSSLVMQMELPTFYSQGESPCAVGDAILVPSADGFYMHLYYISSNDLMLGAYQVDCIDDTVEEEEGAEGEGSEGAEGEGSEGAESGTEGE